MTEGAASDGDGDNSLVTQIESEQLGRLSVSVDRSGSSICVRVAAERAEVLGAMQAHLHVLEHQLQAAGLAVCSIALIRQEQPGTGLALTELTRMARGQQDAPDEEPTAERDGLERGRLGRRKVNLTG
jgi:flagellar hook-length control protein FliK